LLNGQSRKIHRLARVFSLLMYLFLFAGSDASFAQAAAPYSGPDEATIRQIHAAYESGALSVHDLTAAYLARIDAYDKKGPYLN
jgi:hypothetical protein